MKRILLVLRESESLGGVPRETASVGKEKRFALIIVHIK